MPARAGVISKTALIISHSASGSRRPSFAENEINGVNVNKLTIAHLKTPLSIIKLKIPFVGATLDLVIKLESNYFYGFLI